MTVKQRQKPEKPTEDFPLFSHWGGKWGKKINGKIRYFGRWEDPAGALAEYHEFINSPEFNRPDPPKSTPGPDAVYAELAKQREYGRRSRQKAQRMTYLLTDGEFFKIGTTLAPAERFGKVQLGNAREIVVVAMAIGDREKELHDLFDHLRVRGEWFKIDREIVSWFTDNGLVNLQSKEFYIAYRSNPKTDEANS